jgi:hypothetical protein
MLKLKSITWLGVKFLVTNEGFIIINPSLAIIVRPEFGLGEVKRTILKEYFDLGLIEHSFIKYDKWITYHEDVLG